MKIFGILLITLLSANLAHAQRRGEDRRRPDRPDRPPRYENIIDTVRHRFVRPEANGNLTCHCNELERRVGGLSLVLDLYEKEGVTERDYARLADVKKAAELGQDALNYANGRSYDDQESACNEGIKPTITEWNFFQPKLGSRGFDLDYYSGVKKARDGVNINGDEDCPSGSFHVNNDHSQWAASAVIGICSLENGKARLKFNLNRRSQEEKLPPDQRKKCYNEYDYARP